MGATRIEPAADVKSLGFYVNRGHPATMRLPHAHADIEGNFLLTGSVTYLHGGRLYRLGPGELTLFWAGIPHRLIETEEPCEIVWMVIPLAWYMQWQLPESLNRKLLHGEMVSHCPDDREREVDAMLLCRWADEVTRPDKGDPDIRRIVALEMEARFRRFARGTARGTVQRPSLDDATGSHAQRLAAYMSQYYREDLSVDMIAQAAGLHPNYAMQLFRERCGMSLWDYLIRLRISHAQRLLLTTDWKVQRIAMESGFASPSRFYEAFGRIAGCTPRECRRRGV